MKIFIILCIAILNISCAPKIKTERISLQKSDELASTITDEWVATDTEMAVQNIIEKINSHRGFQNYLLRLGRKPKIFIG